MSTVIDLMEATVRLEQPLGDGQSTVGTGFIISATTPGGAPRVVLITADHVLSRMPQDKAKVGFRILQADGAWRYAPASVRIRDAEGDPLWTKHPTQDVAAIELPQGIANAAIPARELPGERALETLKVEPGEEMMVLGYPRGYSANPAGFPILRSGRVASYPLWPADRYPTYLLDFSVFAGNSGGPVYMVRGGSRAPGGAVITGLLTQQIKVRGDRLEIGNVVQADYITETISLLNGEPALVTRSDGSLPVSDPSPASAGAEPTAVERLKQAWRALWEDIHILGRRAWIVVRDAVADLLSSEARRT